MAFVPNTSQTDPNAPTPVGGAPANVPMNLPPATSSGAGGTGGTVGGAPAPGGGVSAQPNAGVQPPVQNLQDYLAANAPQAAGMGQAIATNLTAGANKVTGDIGADLAAIDQSVQASNVAPNPTLVSSAAANPAGFVSNPQNLADFLAQENANYTGPASVEATPTWQSLTTEEQNAVQNAPDVTKPGGFVQLAAGQETNPTAGMTNLDAALLEETPGAAAPILAASQPYANLPGQLSTAATAEDAAIAKAEANDAAAAGLISPAFLNGPNAEVPAFEAVLQNELTGAENTVSGANSGAASILGDVTQTGTLSSLTPAQLAELGISPQEAATIDASNALLTLAHNTMLPGGVYDPQGSGINPATLITQNPVAMPTDISTVATPQDYATEAALEQLLGTRFTPALNMKNVGEAGTFAPGSPVSFNQAGANPDIAAGTNYADFFGNYNPALNSSNRFPAYNPATTYPSTFTPSTLQDYLNQLKGYGGGGPPAEVAALNDLLSGVL